MGNEEVVLHRASGQGPLACPEVCPSSSAQVPLPEPRDSTALPPFTGPWHPQSQGGTRAQSDLVTVGFEGQLGQKAGGPRGNWGDPRGF